MKLILCGFCKDIVALQRFVRSCDCGASSGRYLDRRNAEYSGAAVPLGMMNSDVETAVRRFGEGRPSAIRCWVEHGSPSFRAVEGGGAAENEG